MKCAFQAGGQGQTHTLERLRALRIEGVGSGL